MDSVSGGDAAAIVTTVDQSSSTFTSTDHGNSQGSAPVSDDPTRHTSRPRASPEITAIPEAAVTTTTTIQAPTPIPIPSRLSSEEKTTTTEEKTTTVTSVREQVTVIEDHESKTSGRKSPFSRIGSPFHGNIWGQMKSMKEEFHVPPVVDLKNVNMKIPNVDINMEGYFVGPRDMETHSKWPTFLRLHGSITPRMILPMIMITLWATIVTAISKHRKPLGVSSILLTILGFVVGLSLSFRGATAYERYMEGRKAWTNFLVQGRNLGRYIWVHCQERDGNEGKEDLIAKISAVNLIYAFAVSMKHHLRFEPYTYYQDLEPLVGHLHTFAKAAEHPGLFTERSKKNRWKEAGEYLGLNVAESNPRKAMKRAIKPVGNLPYEVLLYISAYLEMVINNQTMSSTIIYGQCLNAMASITDTMATADRVLTTPLPIGYGVIISQIVLLYVYLLPFQLYSGFGWNTIPATMAAAYIMLGLEAIGNELENPFGNNVNDLPLDQYCNELRRDLDVVMSMYRADGHFADLMQESKEKNKLLWPLSNSPSQDWGMRSKEEIREALKAKVVVGETRRISMEHEANGETLQNRESV